MTIALGLVAAVAIAVFAVLLVRAHRKIARWEGNTLERELHDAGPDARRELAEAERAGTVREELPDVRGMRTR